MNENWRGPEKQWLRSRSEVGEYQLTWNHKLEASVRADLSKNVVITDRYPVDCGLKFEIKGIPVEAKL